MKKNNNYIKYYIVIAVLILATSVLVFTSHKPRSIQSIGTTPEVASGVSIETPEPVLGSNVMYSTTLFSGVSNGASFSVDVGDDTIIVEGDPGADYSSVSVGDVLGFTTASSFDDGILSENVNYFVVTASLSDKFEVSLSRNGTVVDFGSTASGGDGKYFFFRKGIGTTIPSHIDVSNGKYTTLTLDAEETPSASVYFVGSTQDAQPDFYASQSLTNRWDEIYTYDTETSTGVAGATGYSFTGADSHKMYRVYPETLHWISIIFGNYASGSFNIKLMQSD
jgi:hypothetical protein